MRRAPSVVLCTYNGARFLAQQLDSIAAQTHRVAAVHVSDDGSTDATHEILVRMGDRLPLRVTRQPRRLGAAANFAAALAQVHADADASDLVLLCDQDDHWHPRKVEALVAAHEARPDAWLLASDARIVGADGRTRHSSLAATLGVAQPSACTPIDWLRLLLKRNRVAGATVAITRPLIELALPLPPGYWHDEWLALLAAACGKLVWVDEALTDYRQHGNNAAGLDGIGVMATLQGAWSGRRDYDRDKAAKLGQLAARLHDANVAVPPGHRALLDAAAAFWSERASLPRLTWARWRWIAVTARSGAYASFADGARSALRDLIT